jgi:biopolymer transport protein ExbD
MAVMRKKGEREVPAISTASLPDVIFMILFFFMVTTSMKEVDLIVTVKTPSATEIQKLENKALVSYIYVGTPIPSMQGKFGTAPRIQLNDSYHTPQDILDFVASERDKLDEVDRSQMTVSLKVDKDVKMGIVTDIKQELRKANALKISYSATQELKRN